MERIKIKLVKKKGIDIWTVQMEGKDTGYNIRKDSFITSTYYLLYYKNRLKGRFEAFDDVIDNLNGKILEEMADRLLG